ncbi:hypothetical protein IV498_16925 [Paenarthrobacter sp. Z7-10]|nr:hypothetical protein [Paenarthrobacter sp. Z7-10]
MLIGVVAGLLINWQVAPGMVAIYFVIGWAADCGRTQKSEVDVYREDWLNNRKRGGTGPEGGKAGR